MCVLGGCESLDSWATHITQDALVISKLLTDLENQLITSNSFLQHKNNAFKL